MCLVYAMRCALSPDTQFPHTPHAHFARRANLPHPPSLASSGKSQAAFRASCLDEEGRFGRSSRTVGRGCDGRGWHVRRTWRTRTAKSCGPDPPTLESSPLVTNWQATVAIKPGAPRRSRISRKPLRRECRSVFGCTCRRLVCVLAHCCTRGSRVQRHPAFPAPSSIPRVQE